MYKLLTISVILIHITIHSQDLSCDDFKEGVFIAEVTEPVNAKWKIIREGNSQTEIALEATGGFDKIDFDQKPVFEVIEWIDSCSYKLRYDESKFELNEYQQLINKLGGVLNEKIKIEGNCFHYISTLRYQGGEQVVKGKFCKVLE